MRIIGHIGMLEIADNAHADEIGLLNGNPFLRILQALSAQFQRCHVGPVFAGILQYGIFNRQTVGIPSGDIIDLKAGHMMITDNDILQSLVQCMADVNLAVCIRRSVVKDKSRCSFFSPLFDSFFIKLIVLPEFYKLRFFLRKISAHREICLRQLQCLAVIHVLPPA